MNSAIKRRKFVEYLFVSGVALSFPGQLLASSTFGLVSRQQNILSQLPNKHLEALQNMHKEMNFHLKQNNHYHLAKTYFSFVDLSVEKNENGVDEYILKTASNQQVRICEKNGSVHCWV